MSQGLEEILEDQEGDLNPHDGSLHRNLGQSISRVTTLRACVKDVLGGNCSLALPSPKMPINYFDRKQWSRTLLEAATDYLGFIFRKLAEDTNLIKAKRAEWDLN